MNNKIFKMGIKHDLKNAYEIGVNKATRLVNSTFQAKIEEYMTSCYENKLTEKQKYDIAREMASVFVTTLYKESLPIMKEGKEKKEFIEKKDCMINSLTLEYKRCLDAGFIELKKDLERDKVRSNKSYSYNL